MVAVRIRCRHAKGDQGAFVTRGRGRSRDRRVLILRPTVIAVVAEPLSAFDAVNVTL